MGDAGTDNPDQRIAEDLERFTAISLGLSLGLMSSAVTLFSFLSMIGFFLATCSALFAFGGLLYAHAIGSGFRDR